jgi:hypothetical protein
MKRDGFVIEEIIQQSNLEDAFNTVLRGNMRKRLCEGRWLLAHKDEFLKGVAAEIEAGEVKLGKWHPKDIVEAGKARHLQVFDMKTRIKVAAVMQVVDKHLRRRFIRTTAASIKRRGLHDLKAYIERDLRNDPHGMKYLYKFDVRKFYDTAKQDFIKYCFRRVFKDKRLIGILDCFVSTLDEGISMGMRSSQGLGNLLLSVFLDHYLKDRYGIKHFYRYCDDGLIGHGMKLILWEHRKLVHNRIELMGQQVKQNDRIFPADDGLDFLGYLIFPRYALIRKRVKKNYARRLKRVKSRKRRVEIVGSLWGMAKHANCWHLLEKLLFRKEFIKLKKKAMKDFGKAKSEPKTIDGKKSFRGKKVNGGELFHKPFIVVDFEKDVIPSIERERYKREVDETLAKGGDTSLVKKPRPKYVVSLIFQNELRKFWTGDKENWDELDRRREEPDGIPFFASMEADYSGQYPKFTFCSATALGFQMPTDEELERLFTQLKIK